MSSQKISILVPNYKMPEWTKVCLRLIRKHTDPDYVKVIVIADDSRDESLVYLRSLRWIELVERGGTQTKQTTNSSSSHSHALDLGMQQVDTPYVLSMHTDTLVHHPRWLQFLVEQIGKDDNIAGVGSWKLEKESLLKRVETLLKYYMLSLSYDICNKVRRGFTGEEAYYYLHSHCALYRTELLRKYALTFSSGGNLGRMIHQQLRQHGHLMLFLSPEKLLRYAEHIDHATTTLNPKIRCRKSHRKDKKRIQKTLQRFDVERLLADTSLDR